MPDVEERWARERGALVFINTEDLREMLAVDLVDYPSFGYRRLSKLVEQRGFLANSKRVLRVMKELKEEGGTVAGWPPGR
jgi:hypothetical protein